MPTLFRPRFGVVQRSQGQTATGRSDYQRCRGEYAAKASEHAGGWMMLPEGAPEWACDPDRLWRQCEAVERRGDAQVARTIELTIPRAVPAHLHRQFVEWCLAPLVTLGMAAQVDLHHERTADGMGWNDHAHAMLTMRRFDGDKFSKTKERAWNTAFTTNDSRDMREQFAARMNEFFAASGIEARVDARSYEARGLPVPPAPEVPKKLWKQWERKRAKDPAAPPPRQIAEYQCWMQERAVAIQTAIRVQKEYDHERAADHSGNQAGHQRNPGVTGAGRRAIPLDATPGLDGRNGRRTGGTADGGGRLVSADRRRAARTKAAAAQLSRALTPEILAALKAQVSAIRIEGRAALMEQEARELTARAVRQTDPDRILAQMVPASVSQARSKAWMASERAKDAVQRHERGKPTGIMSRFNGEATRWQQEHDRLTIAMGVAQIAYGQAVEHEEAMKRQHARQAMALAAENKSLNTADRAEAAELRQVAQALRAYHVPTLDAAARRQPPTRRRAGGGGGGGGSSTMAHAAAQPDSYKSRTDANGVGDISWMTRFR